MNGLLKYICAAATALMAFGCGPKDGKDGGELKALGPEDTVREFYKAVSCGDFDKAYELCDTVSMNTYLQMNRDARKELEQADSTAARIASGMLSGAGISFGNTARDGDRRQVRYSIDAGMGMKKEKTATVKKENGVWKVEKITDAQ